MDYHAQMIARLSKVLYAFNTLSTGALRLKWALETQSFPHLFESDKQARGTGRIREEIV